MKNSQICNIYLTVYYTFSSPCSSGLAVIWSLVTVLRTESFPSLSSSVSVHPGPLVLPVSRSTGVRSCVSAVGLICLWKALKSMSMCFSLSRPNGRGWAVTDGEAWLRERTQEVQTQHIKVTQNQCELTCANHFIQDIQCEKLWGGGGGGGTARPDKLKHFPFYFSFLINLMNYWKLWILLANCLCSSFVSHSV